MPRLDRIAGGKSRPRAGGRATAKHRETDPELRLASPDVLLPRDALDRVEEQSGALAHEHVRGDDDDLVEPGEPSEEQRRARSRG